MLFRDVPLSGLAGSPCEGIHTQFGRLWSSVLALHTLHFGFLPGTDLVPSDSPREIGLADSTEDCCSQLDSWLDSVKFHCAAAPPPVVIWCWDGGGGRPACYYDGDTGLVESL